MLKKNKGYSCKSINRILRKTAVIILAGIIGLSSSACSCKKKESKQPAMKIGSSDLTEGIVRYYAYNAQASYENYYMASGSHIHWSEGKNKVTLEDQVKEQTLEEMVKKYKLINHAKDFEVDKSDVREKDLSDMIDNYKKNTADALKDKVDASDDDLKKIFTTYILYDDICEYIKEQYNIVVEKDLYRQVSINLIEVTGDDAENTAVKICSEVNKGGKIVDVASKYKQEVIEGTIGAGDRDRDKIELACLTMKTGECVSVNTDLKYYVIYCVNDNDEKATEIMVQDKEKELLNQQIDLLVKNYKDEVKLDEEMWKKINYNDPIFEDK